MQGGRRCKRAIAEQRLSQYEVKITGRTAAVRELDAAVSELKAVTHPQDLYADVHDIMRELTAGDAAIPSPIRYSHGGFDNDCATMNSVLTRILGTRQRAKTAF